MRSKSINRELSRLVSDRINERAAELFYEEDYETFTKYGLAIRLRIMMVVARIKVDRPLASNILEWADGLGID